VQSVNRQRQKGHASILVAISHHETLRSDFTIETHILQDSAKSVSRPGDSDSNQHGAAFGRHQLVLKLRNTRKCLVRPPAATSFDSRKEAQKAQKKKICMSHKMCPHPVVVLRLLRLFAAIQTI